jgi:hypothetical protein
MAPVALATTPTLGPDASNAEKHVDLARLQQVLAICQEWRASLTTTYPDWFTLGCAIHHAFGAEIKTKQKEVRRYD